MKENLRLNFSPRGFEMRLLFLNSWHAQSFVSTIWKIVSQFEKEPRNVPSPWVQFRINDACVPEPGQILIELHGTDLLSGKIIDISDLASCEEAFAVVEVEGLSQPVVVAMKHVKSVPR